MCSGKGEVTKHIGCRFAAIVDDGILIKMVMFRFSQCNSVLNKCVQIQKLSVLQGKAQNLSSHVLFYQRVEDSPGDLNASKADTIIGILDDMKALKAAA